MRTRIAGVAAGASALLAVVTGSPAAAGPPSLGPSLGPPCAAVVADARSSEVTSVARQLGIAPAEAATRIGWQNAAEQLDARAAAATPSYGGLWIDPSSGRLRLGVAGSDTASLRAVASACGLGGAVDVVPVAHTASALTAANTVIGDRLVAIDDPATSGFAVGVDVAANRVLLDVPSHRAWSAAERALVAEVKSRWAGLVVVRPVAGDAVPAACSSGNFCTPPLRGGIAMFNASSGCSLGFTARSRTDGAWYALSAGHCGGGTWSTLFPDGSEHAIGPWHNGTFSSRGDAQIIRVSNPSGWTPRPWVLVEASADTSYDESYNITAVGGSSVGMRICKSGYSGGSDCGTVTRLGVAVDYGSVVVRNMGEANFCVIPGDSGGPVFASHRAYGLTSGYSPGANPCRSFYQGAAGAEDLLNVNIATGS